MEWNATNLDLLLDGQPCLSLASSQPKRLSPGHTRCAASEPWPTLKRKAREAKPIVYSN